MLSKFGFLLFYFKNNEIRKKEAAEKKYLFDCEICDLVVEAKSLFRHVFLIEPFCTSRLNYHNLHEHVKMVISSYISANPSVNRLFAEQKHLYKKEYERTNHFTHFSKLPDCFIVIFRIENEGIRKGKESKDSLHLKHLRRNLPTHQTICSLWRGRVWKEKKSSDEVF